MTISPMTALRAAILAAFVGALLYGAATTDGDICRVETRTENAR